MKGCHDEVELYLEAISFMGLELNQKKAREFLDKIARSDKTVLILGETGTGKDVLARKIHDLSDRKNAPFVAINCASIPQDLFEAEFFGFSKGAFTGAYKDKMGLLEAAQKGTAFLDEIGDLSLALQAKLLRVIDNRTFRRIGETRDRCCQARFIFATNKDLREAVKAGHFRRDLYYRISIIQIHIDPLRFHLRLVPMLAQSIVNKENKEHGLCKRLSEDAIKKLMTYNFPGNIRELVNIIERAILLSEDDLIRSEDIQFDNNLVEEIPGKILTADQLKLVLEACRWNKSEAAKKIGKSRRHLYRLLQKYKLDYLM